ATEELALQSSTKFRGGCAGFQELGRAIAHSNLKGALCFFLGTPLQCKLANKKVGLAEALSTFPWVRVFCRSEQCGRRSRLEGTESLGPAICPSQSPLA